MAMKKAEAASTRGTVSEKAEEVIDALGKDRSWLRSAPKELAAALEAALAKEGAIRVREDRIATLRFRWERSTVEFRITETGPTKCTVAMERRGLSGPEEVEARRPEWRATLDALRERLASV